MARGKPQGSRYPVVAIGFGLAALSTTILLVWMISPLAKPLLWAAIITMLVFPVHRRIRATLGSRPTLAAAATTSVVVLLFVAPATVITTQSVHEARDLIPAVKAFAKGDSLRDLEARVGRSPLGPLVNGVMGPPPEGGSRWETLAESTADAMRGWVLRHLASAASGAAKFVVHLAVTLLAVFFLLRDGPRFVDEVRRLLPLPEEYTRHLEQRISETVAAVFRGVFIAAVAQGALIGAAYFITGLPAPVLLTALTMAAALVPIGGAAIIWIPAALALGVSGSVPAAAGLTAWCLAISAVEHLVKPIVIGAGAQLPVLLLLLAILGGLQTFGPLGILLGPAVLAVGMACLRIYREDRDLWKQMLHNDRTVDPLTGKLGLRDEPKKKRN